MDLLWTMFEKSGNVEIYLKYKERERNDFESLNKGGLEVAHFGENKIMNIF
ncbi:MAG: YqzL family protein [Tyzzerella sp.]|uniref:YqzL family protein n=1 Tax=Candidatus Fimicola merdigallinarum TaxID=2840819 RepID=A0A9D9H3X6_9FIRM|nr:YqzL family protein [Candidatus Fimicola merdigallinarum]